MSVTDVGLVMQHIRALDVDLPLVQLYLNAAEDTAARFMGRRFYADSDALAAAVLDGTAGTDPIVVTPSITAACMLIAATLFANREDIITGVSVERLPTGSLSMLRPYRIDMGV